MQEYISVNMYQRRVEVNCGTKENVFVGIVMQVLHNVLVLDVDGNNIYIAIDKIVSLKELPE